MGRGPGRPGVTLLEVLAGANVALRLIQARIVTVIALLLTFAMFSWAMWLQTTLGAMIAVAWGLSIFLPVLFTGRGGHDGSSVPEEPAQHPEGEARP